MVRSEGGGCPAEDALLSFVDGRGSAEDRARVEQHMDECDDCRAAISALAAASPPPVDAISSAPTLPDTGDPPPAATGGGTLSPGTRLGRYVITALEGKGGMGEVYAAEDPALGRRVAIKVLRRDLSSGSAGSLEERLAREAQAMARLNHPAVVTVYDVGELDGRIFIAMEYVAGQTLAGWLAAEERPWRQVLARFIAAGRGLAAAHAAGLVHRDFKPENVLLGEDGRPRVADFGVARPLGVIEAAAPAGSPGTSPLLASSLTATGAVIGTPIYMAPEQLRGEPATPASDQFSFCASLYVGLHGARPFSGDTVTSLMKEVERGALREPPPGEQRVPAQVRRAVARGLASDP
ncbi:MAG TPA: protein kinase, partial [Kofleriaceae bacterium]|nr:protein kinase [Kofleriaceae bacterium]